MYKRQGTFAQGPLFSPSVTSAVTPSPAKKRISLSDYTKRNKKGDGAGDGKGRDSSPASISGAPAAPSDTEQKVAELIEGVKAAVEKEKAHNSDSPQAPSTDGDKV